MKRPITRIIRARRANALKAAAKGQGFKAYRLKLQAKVISQLANGVA